MRESNRQPAGWVPDRTLTFQTFPARYCDGTRPRRNALAAMESGGKSSSRSIANQDLIAMPRENDLEGAQDQGGKHGGQKSMPKPEPKPPHGPDQGIVRDEKGQEQPRDKARAQQVHRTDTAGR